MKKQTGNPLRTHDLSTVHRMLVPGLGLCHGFASTLLADILPAFSQLLISLQRDSSEASDQERALLDRFFYDILPNRVSSMVRSRVFGLRHRTTWSRV